MAKHEAEHKQDTRTRLIEDVRILAQYARENGLAIETVEAAQQLLNDGDHGVDVAQLTKHYETLSRAAGKVTPDSLRATQCINEGYWKSAAGKHLLKLWFLTLLAGVFILCHNLLNYRIPLMGIESGDPDAVNHLWYDLQHVTHYLLPFSYGGLGACAYLLRVTAEKFRSREFKPDRIPEHWNRLVLGTLSGGVIVLFVQLEGYALAEGALGFLAGYSIDFLFETLDRVIAAILPKTGVDTVARKMEQQRHALVLKRYQERLAKATDPNEKKLLTEVVTELQG